MARSELTLLYSVLDYRSAYRLFWFDLLVSHESFFNLREMIFLIVVARL